MSEHTPTTYAVRTNYAMTMLRVGRKDIDPYSAFDRWLAEHDREVAAKAWEEGFDEPRECCGLCPKDSCPWDNGQGGPSNPYEQKGVEE